MHHMDKFGKHDININVKGLIVFLLLVDIVVMTVLVLQSQEETREVLIPTAPPTATAVAVIEETPEPTEEEPVETKHDTVLNMKYQRDVYTAEDPSAGFVSEWVISGDGSAYAETMNTYETVDISVYTTGNNISSVSLTKGGIPLDAGRSYYAFLNISSSVPRTVNLVASDGNTGTVFGTKTIEAKPESTYYEWAFPVTTTTYNGVLSIEFGNNGITEAHTIHIEGIRIAGGDDNAAVRTNQIGYLTNQQKRCTFIYSCGDLFDVVNKETGVIEYTGAIVGRLEDSDTGEIDYTGDFSNFRKAGTYFIRSQTGVISHDFVIEADPYADLRRSALRMLSYQRCGEDLGEWAEELSHPACHTSEANFYLTELLKDVTGGWHDAGDYGRYLETGAKSVNDLLLSYLTAPELFDDDNQGPDSGNGVPDILDEARYELEWMMKMQDEESGAYFCKATTQSFPDDEAAPESDTAPLYLLAPDTVSTSAATGSLALASFAFQTIDPAFAERCLESAKNADHYLKTHRDWKITMNPSDFSTGQYLDDNDKDGRFTADMALYLATGDTGYLESAKETYEEDPTCVNSVKWQSSGMYGAYLFLASSNGEKDDPEFYNTMLTAIANAADSLINLANETGYGVANRIYTWGSNSDVANAGIVLAMAYDFTGKQIYFQSAVEQLNYLLGKNSLDMCFVSGYGFRSPTNQHNRLTLSKGVDKPGFLSGGPDASREDNVTAAMPYDTPVAKMYADDANSYSTNEIAIYYNSAMLYLISSLS